uniref:Schwann cell myelin protein-like isoform X3 n=1 Tax=Gasterosteus aculeatus aculeatus TaxID=481459 RepID=UPI001A97F124|nr:Schwann cell myelin protein-like isoform X3 [Gasterosteus aculeatus aculeatus]
MFVLILLFSVRHITAATGSSVRGKENCNDGSCVTFSKGEIKAEAGLCVVIPCSFKTSKFTPKHLVFYKCESSKRFCTDSDVIFDSDRNSNKVQAGFVGRVSLLKPDVRLRNCGIIINDLTESDSGSYQLRVNGLKNGRENGLTFPQKINISVKGLTQKPTVGIPPLTEGQQTTLSCTAPGLCSGSDPEITWTWRGAGEKDSHITGNITAVKTEHLTSVTRRHISTLTFKPSAEHRSTNVTCKVRFTNDVTTEETETLNVTYVKDFNISGITSVKEGETLNLTCRVESFPPSLIAWTKSPESNTQNETDTNRQNNTGTFMQKESGMSTFYAFNVTPEHSGRYICTAEYLNQTLVEDVDVKVIYVRSPVITGSTTVVKGAALNLTCGVESFPPSRITWATFGSGTTLERGLDADPQNGTGWAASLVIPHVAAEDSGRYTCTAQHLDRTVTTYADVTVIWPPRFLSRSRCEVRSEVLTCVCVSEGLLLPSITWPLLKNHSEYSVVTTVSGHTVHSTLTLRDHVGTSIECVSSNDHGEAKENLKIQQNTPGKEADQSSGINPWLQVIIAFFIGVLLSAVFCCLATKCHRRKQEISTNRDETYEMVTSQAAPLINGAQAVEDDHTYYQESSEGEWGAAAAPDLDAEPKDVLYASIDFSLLRRKNLSGAAKSREATKTEYAEIKKVVEEEMENNGGEGGNASGGSRIREDEEDEVAVYSSVKDVMSEI